MARLLLLFLLYFYTADVQAEERHKSIVILLNGISSSGKTTLAKAIQQLSPKPFLLIQFDTFWNMIPTQYLNDEPLAEKVLGSLPKVVKILADGGNNIIIDAILMGDSGLSSYVQALSPYTSYFIGVTCDTKVLNERAAKRQATYIVKKQVHTVHGPPDRHYDLIVDTTNTPALSCAQSILDFIRTHPAPSSFQKLRAIYNIAPAQ